MPSSSSSPVARVASALSVQFLLAAAAWGQNADTQGRVQALDSIVVSGERVERSLRNTASSVSALSDKDIAGQTNKASVEDVITGTPNLIYPDTVSAPVIRGQDTQGPNFGASAFLGGTTPRATINVDGRYLSYNELVFGATSIWDLDSIEVYRGPQTSTQGANSIAGAIIVNTKDPTFYTEGAAQLQLGSNDMRRASAMLSGPVGDELAARLAVDYYGRDTFIDYTNPNFAKGDSDQNFKSLNTRLKLLWTPSSLPGLEGKLTLVHTENNRPTSEAASKPYDHYESTTLSMPSFKQRANTVIGDISYDFDNGMRLSNRIETTDLSVRRVTSPMTNGGADIDQRNFSNETRLNWGDESSAWSGVTGVFYNRTTSEDSLFIRGLSQFDDKKNNLGIYTEVTRRLAERWRLTAGLRYQRDRIERSGTTPYARAPLDYGQTYSALLPKLSLAYDVSPDVTVGALVSKGYNPGGVGLSFARGQYMEYEEESVWNYELFSRASLLGGRMNLTGNLFYSDFRDSQRLVPDYLDGVLYGAVTVNADKARSYGMELSMDYQVLDTLRIRSGIGLLHTRISKFSDGGSVLEGKEFGRAPSYTLSFGVDWDATPKLNVAFNIRRTDSYYSTDENISAYKIDAYTVADTRLSYALHKNLEIFAYANNLFDERSPTWMYDDRTAGGIVASMLPQREFGIGVKATF
ncbi:MAG: TonB-dependent receptor [Pusillimonas sp.]